VSGQAVGITALAEVIRERRAVVVMALSLRTQKYIWGLFAGRCAICREVLIHEGDAGERSLVGEIAHIVGERPAAARGGASLTEEERADPSNLLLLCQKHHKIVDDNPDQYPVSRLHQIRADYLSWLEANLERPVPWSLVVSAFAYLNVPRLSEYAAMNGYRIAPEDVPPGMALNDMGFDLNRIMESFRATLENIAISGINADQIAFAHDGYVGQIIRFDRMRFRTKNIHPSRMGGSERQVFTGDLAKDPHIYHRFPEWKLVLNINPRWVTTDTAFVAFRPSGGESTFTGFGRVTAVDLESQVMTCTALAIGFPKPLFDIFDPKPRVEATAPVDFESLMDELSIRRGTVWGGSIEHCDFCGRDMNLEEFMVDGPMKPGGPWGCMCSQCYSKARLPLGIGKGQLFRKKSGDWVLVGGYPLAPDDED
jgi:hypothetical protein